MRLRLVQLFLAGLLFSPVVGAEPAPSLLEFELRSLEEPEVHQLSRYQGKPLVMIFFQPECNWCAKQIEAINKLRKQCHREIEAVAIGFGSNRTELRKELRRLRPDFPAYQASPKLIAEVGGVVATPVTLLGDSDGRFVSWTRGFVPYERPGSRFDRIRLLISKTQQESVVTPILGSSNQGYL